MHSLLATLPLFSGLGDKSLERLAKAARQIHATKGTLLFSPGETPEGLYTVVSGLVKLAVPTAAEQEKVVTLLGPGKAFGLAAVFADEPYVTSAAAVQEAVVVRVAKAQVIAVMKRDPLFARSVAANLSRRLR